MKHAGVAEMTAKSPLGQHMDWQVLSMENDRATFRMPFHEHNVTIGNMVHGGAIAALADAVATAACWATDQATSESRGATITLNINYLAAALGCDLIASAWVVQRGGSVCVVDVVVTDPDEKAIARATVTYKLSHGRR